MDTKIKKALIVLGMHRSGASVLGGCFDLLGLNRERHSAANSRNDEYTPNHAIMVQHEILLKELGCRWDMVGNLPLGWEKSKAANNAAEKIAGILDRGFAENRVAMINDPRMCRLMPMWMDILEQGNIEPCFVLLVRQPYEVARSLEKFMGIDLLSGHLLWLAHNREALSAIRGHNFITVTYDGLLADPVHCMEKIGKRLQIDFARPPRQSYFNLIGFVRSDLKHHYGGSRDNSDQRFSRYEWLYNQLRITQVPSLEHTWHGGGSGRPGDHDLENEIEIDGFPLVIVPESGKEKTDAVYITEVFDDLLAVLSTCERNRLNSEVQRERLLLDADHNGGALYARICFPEPDNGEPGYGVENPRKILLAPDVWQKISVPLPDPGLLCQGRLRIDPLNVVGTVILAGINLVNPSNGEVIRAISHDDAFSQCAIEGEALFAGSLEQSVMIYVTGKDACIMLPAFPDLPDLPLDIEIWLKVSRNLKQLTETWNEREANLNKVEAQGEELTQKLERQQSANDEQVFELVRQLGEIRQKQQKKQEDVEDYRSRLLESEARVDEIWKKVADQDERAARYSAELVEAKHGFAELYVWFTRLADLLGFDETTASSSVHLVKKSSKVFSRKAPIDEIQTVFRNFYSMMPNIDAFVEPEDEE